MRNPIVLLFVSILVLQGCSNSQTRSSGITSQSPYQGMETPSGPTPQGQVLDAASVERKYPPAQLFQVSRGMFSEMSGGSSSSVDSVSCSSSEYHKRVVLKTDEASVYTYNLKTITGEELGVAPGGALMCAPGGKQLEYIQEEKKISDYNDLAREMAPGPGVKVEYRELDGELELFATQDKDADGLTSRTVFNFDQSNKGIIVGLTRMNGESKGKRFFAGQKRELSLGKMMSRMDSGDQYPVEDLRARLKSIQVCNRQGKCVSEQNREDLLK